MFDYQKIVRCDFLKRNDSLHLLHPTSYWVYYTNKLVIIPIIHGNNLSDK